MFSPCLDGNMYSIGSNGCNPYTSWNGVWLVPTLYAIRYENKIVDKCSSQSFLFSLTNFVSKVWKTLFIDLTCPFSLWIINSRIGKSRNKMVSKVYDHIVDKMGTLIGHNYQWTSKFRKNMFIIKLGNYSSNVGAKCSCFHPLYYTINGYLNVLIVWYTASMLNRSKPNPHFWNGYSSNIITNLVKFCVNRLPILWH